MKFYSICFEYVLLVQYVRTFVLQSCDGTKVYDTCIDEEGLNITVIEEDGGSLTVSDVDEDMHDYYNQPETLLEDIPEATETVPVVVGVPLLDDAVPMATGDAATLGATGEISTAQLPEVSSGEGDGVTMTTGDGDLPPAGISASAKAALDKAKDMQKQLDEFFKQGREQKGMEGNVEEESS